MTLAWLARIAAALFVAYAVAAEREGVSTKGSPGLEVLSGLAALALGITLVWAGWWA